MSESLPALLRALANNPRSTAGLWEDWTRSGGRADRLRRIADDLEKITPEMLSFLRAFVDAHANEWGEGKGRHEIAYSTPHLRNVLTVLTTLAGKAP